MQPKVAVFANHKLEDAISVLRLKEPLQLAGFQVIDGSTLLETEKVDLSGVSFITFLRDFPRHWDAYQRLTKSARDLDIPVILDLDDLLWELPEDHPDRRSFYYASALLPTWIAAQEADAVTVSTPALMEFVRGINPRVKLLPNYWNDMIWSLRPPDDPLHPKRRVVLGYMGGHTHQPDLLMVLPVLERLLSKYEDKVLLRFFGIAPPKELMKFDNVEHVESWATDYYEFASLFAQQEWDIGFAPLKMNRFNQSKSPVKFFEYSALGIPGVYSCIDQYQWVIEHGINGFLASTLEEWEQNLIELIEDPFLRFNMAVAAQQSLQERWLLSEHAFKWRETYQEIRESMVAPEENRTTSPMRAMASQLIDREGQITAMQVHLAKKEQVTQTLNEQKQALMSQVIEKDRLIAALQQQIAEQARQIELLQAQLRDWEQKNSALARELTGLKDHLNQREQILQDLNNKLLEIYSSTAWKIIQRMWRARLWLAPRGSWRESIVRKGLSLILHRQNAVAFAGTQSLAAQEKKSDPLMPITRDGTWNENGLSRIEPMPISQVTDIVICIGPDPANAEKCIESIRRHTISNAYKMHLVVHKQDAAKLSRTITQDANVVEHSMDVFSFARANNMVLRHSENDVVLLNDDTLVTDGWLESLKRDSRGVALTGAHTEPQASGNPDMWGEGTVRFTWYPINMFCAYIPKRVREVVGLLDEEFSYYGGEDVDYSCRALKNGFPLIISSTFVHHKGNRSYGELKIRLMQETDKMLLERYSIEPPFSLSGVTPLVSVVMATHNRAKLLPAAAHSVLDGWYKNIQLLIVDDASSDTTWKVIRELQEDDQRVFGIKLPTNVGAVRARQIGIDASLGDFIAFHDDDDNAWPNRVYGPLNYLISHPNVDASYSGFQVIDEKGRRIETTESFDPDAYLEGKYLIGLGTFLVRAGAIRKVPFSANYDRATDFDWVFRMVRRGFRIDSYPEVVLDYNRYGGEGSHLSGNERSIAQHKDIYEREKTVEQFRRRSD